MSLVDSGFSFRRTRFAIWISLVVLILGGQVGWFVLLRGERILDSEGLLIGGQLSITAALMAMLWLLRSTPADAIKLRRTSSNVIILVGAAALQAAAVGVLWPGLSDDVVRYRIEGRMWLSGVSPYAHSPDDFRAIAPESVDAVDRTVTYPHMPTIYPPVAQLLFASGRAIEMSIPLPAMDHTQGHTWRAIQAELPWWQRAAVFRILLAAAAVIATAMLLRLLQDAGKSPWYAAVAAWHPLSIVECGGMGHVEIVGVLLILGAIMDARRSRFIPAAVWLALSMAVKPQAVLALPFLWRDAWRGEANGCKSVDRALFPLVALGLAGLLYAAAFIYQDGYAGWLQTATTYSRHWEANGSIYELLKAVIGRGDDHQIVLAKRIARMIPLFVMVAGGIVLWRRQAVPAVAVYWLMLAVMLTGPVVYPWYLLWMLWMIPLLPPSMGWTGMTWTATVVISYLLWRQPTWNLPIWASLAQYVPVYVVLVAELMITRNRYPAADCGHPRSQRTLPHFNSLRRSPDTNRSRKHR